MYGGYCKGIGKFHILKDIFLIFGMEPQLGSPLAYSE